MHWNILIFSLSPFYNISRMIDLMTFFIKLMLIAIVLVSIMNVMIMAVYERIREIGTIAAIGTMPEKILCMFIIEGFFLGIFGTVCGIILGSIGVYVINIIKISFNFGRNTGLILSPSITVPVLATYRFQRILQRMPICIKSAMSLSRT